MEGTERSEGEPGSGEERAPERTESEAPAAPSLEGQRAWLGQLDRKLSTRTYAGAAATVLALAAAIVAIVLAIDLRETSATEADLDRLREEVTGVAEEAGEVGTLREELEEGVTSLEDRLSSLERQVNRLGREEDRDARRIDVLEDEIEDLRQEIADLEP